MPVSIPRKNNFTFLRFVLSFTVLFRHCMDSSVSPAFQEIKNIFASQDAVCLFFAISGLLVTASYERCESLREYFSRRVSRIFPLYLAAVIGAALLLSLASSMPAPCYFMHTDFWKYIFWNSLT